MALIKNKHGVIVSVTPERKAFLLNENPVAMGKDGRPKKDNNGNTFPIIKAEHEKGWKDVTTQEEKEYHAREQEEQEAAEDAQNAKEAAGMVAVASALAAKKSEQASERAANKKKAAGRPKKPAKDDENGDAGDVTEEELEAQARDAEGDAEKYDALSDGAKAKYLELFEKAPEGSK